MVKPIYITHSVVISPQHTTGESLLKPIMMDEKAAMRCVEPPYAEVIPAMQLRRMSRLLKMGIYCGIKCMEQSGVDVPDAIITGTGKGSMVDTEKFVKDLNYYQEAALNPTPFILSTYNAVNGALALQRKATGYNQTFVHRGSSFELALYDAKLRLNEDNNTNHVLIGGFDELTDEYIIVKEKIGKWKKDRDNTRSLWQQADTPGTLAGEGAAFFMTQKEPSSRSLAWHQGSFFVTDDIAVVEERLKLTLAKALWKKEDIDLLLLGYNGDINDTPFYESVREYVGIDKPVMVFKHLCGEYETSGGFGLWLLMQYLQGKNVPKDVWYAPDSPVSLPRKILYYNHYQRQNQNIMLLEYLP